MLFGRTLGGGPLKVGARGAVVVVGGGPFGAGGGSNQARTEDAGPEADEGGDEGEGPEAALPPEAMLPPTVPEATSKPGPT